MTGVLALLISISSSVSWAIPRVGCGPANSNIRDLHRVALMGADNRKLFSEYAREKRLRQSAVDRMFEPMGELNCLGFESTAQLSGSNNVITGAGHVFFDLRCNPRNVGDSCFFRPRGSEQTFELDLSSMKSGCRPYDLSADWFVVKLKTSVPNRRFYEVPRAEVSFTENQKLTMASNNAANFERNGELPPHVQECAVRIVSPTVKHDCDTGSGASGTAWLADGPNGFQMVGVDAGSGSDSGDGREFHPVTHYNTGAPLVGEFFRALNEALGR